MSQFLETLKARLADSQQRLQVAQAKLQQVQQEHQMVMQEYASWQNAVAVESRREQQAQPTAQSASLVIAASPPIVVAGQTVSKPVQESQRQDKDINKAEMIRDVLRQHPNGITPADLWRAVRDHVGRAYVYSVLKRLKDRKQVSERRGKYFLLVVAKTEEESKETQSTAIQ